MSLSVVLFAFCTIELKFHLLACVCRRRYLTSVVLVVFVAQQFPGCHPLVHRVTEPIVMSETFFQEIILCLTLHCYMNKNIVKPFKKF